MNWKRLILSYVVAYLIVGGLGLALVPDAFLDLFQSNQDYGDIMPRLAGMFMVGLGSLVAVILYYQDYKYYPFSVLARTAFVVFIFVLYAMSDDPFFLVINVIVLIGLVPSFFVLARERARGEA